MDSTRMREGGIGIVGQSHIAHRLTAIPKPAAEDSEAGDSHTDCAMWVASNQQLQVYL